MQQFSPDKIRNVAFLSHSGSGKTSLAESLLFDAGVITRIGNVADGTTTSDYDPDEIKHRISINLSILPLAWKNTKINIIDTPGYPDFVGEVHSALRVSEGAVILVCAASGVEVGTEQVWDYAAKAKVPRLIFMNKMDRENANFAGTLEQIQSKLSNRCVPIQLPIGSQKNFKGIIDIITKKAYAGSPLKEIEMPETMAADVDSAREKLIEAVVEIDDEIMTRYLDGGEITTEEIYKCIKASTLQGALIPVLAGSGLTNNGAVQLLDAIVEYLPTPVTAAPVKATNASGAEEELKPATDAPLAALVFKTTTDPHVGKLNYFRVYSGTFSSNSQVWNVNKNAVERVGQVSMARGKSQEVVNQVTAGDIGLVVKLANTVSGDTLGVKEHTLKLSPLFFPAPILSKAVYPKSKADLDKMSTGLARICEEDPSLKSHREADVGELILSGMGDTHLEIAASRLHRKFAVEVNLEIPRVPYKETITKPSDAEYKHKKQTGGHGQFGHVLIEMEPLDKGGGFEFAERIVGGSVPRNYIPAVEKGIKEARMEGVLAGFPAVDMKVTLYDGSFHPVDSSEMAFKIASIQAFKKGMQDGGPVLLEPIMNMTVTVPDSFTGDIIGDLNTKRARVMGMSPSQGMNVIQAQAPQSEILRYAIDLRSMTQGRGTFTVEFSHYEAVPAIIAQKIIAQHKTESQ
ncbi:MAG: elongation factor G [Dehalococcoidia bacterium]|nr:elongation factor G [Dehalococcoidia bacterium]